MRSFLYFCLGISFSLAAFSAFAQAGSDKFGSWSTVRSGFQSVTTFTRGSEYGGTAFVVNRQPDATGIRPTRLPTSSPNAVAWHKSYGIPLKSGQTGLTQIATITAEREATRGAVLRAAGKAARLSTPLGWGILAGSLVIGHLDWDPTDGLKTDIQKEVPEGQGSEYPAEPVPCWTHSTYSPSCATDPTAKAAQAAQSYCNQVGTPCTGYGGVTGLVFHSDLSPTVKRYNFNYSYWGTPQPHNLSVTNTSVLGCPKGGTLQGQMCVLLPEPAGCPYGSSMMLQPLSDEYKCAPNQPLAFPFAPLTDLEVEDILDRLLGQNPTKLGDLVDDLLEGMPIESPGNPKVSGPSSLPPTVTTAPTTNPTGTVTSTTAINLSYNTNIVNITENTTNVYKDENGNVIGTTTNPNPPPEEVPPSISDGNLPNAIDFYTQKYPDGFVGVWNERKSALQSSPFVGLIGALTPSWSGGTCPTWNIPSLMGIQIGELKPPCEIWTAIRIVLLVSALFLARSLIFGG